MKTSPPLRLLASLALLLAPQALHATFPAGSNSFAAAPQISVFNDSSTPTSILAFTKEVDEPGHRPEGAASAEKSAWWQWTAPANGYVTLNTFRVGDLTTPVLNTTLAVYTGATLDQLIRIATNDNHGGIGLHPAHTLSSVSFYALQGTNYRIAVDGASIAAVNADHTNVCLEIRLTELKKSTRSAVFAASAAPGNVGTITVTTTTGPTLSGRLVCGGKAYPFAGTFGTDGYFTTSVLPKASPGTPQPLPITLRLDLAGIGHYHIDFGTQFSTGLEFPARITFTPFFQNSTTGLYPSLITSPDSPAGDGIASINVRPNGTVTGIGISIDGTRFTFSSALQQTVQPDAAYHFPVYASLFQGRGSFAMNSYLLEKPAGDELLGYSLHIRPAPTSGPLTFFPAGLTTSCETHGTSYTKPLPGARALDFLAPTYGGELKINNLNGELPGDIEEDVTLTDKNKFVFASPVYKPVLTLNPATGLLTGSVTANGKKRVINAVLTKVLGVPTLGGHLIGTTTTLAIEVVP
ncbi:MAG: hypothetical protein V4672_23415 [Verrucomicrobiota bacterium]